jgi:hypothetical protein
MRNSNLPSSSATGVASRNIPLLVALLLAVTLPFATGAQQRVPRKQPLPGAPPRLVVVLVIDQFRADYLDLYRNEFGDGGFLRLMREGAVFRECFYPYALTETGPGHATLATGTTPDRHGIAANEWFNPALGKTTYALLDESSQVVGGTPGQTPVSPRNLNGSSLSDEMRLATGGKSLVFGVALKDRAAILSTGHGANGAYWFDSGGTGFVTSTYYRPLLPEWVTAFNRGHALQLPTDPAARRQALAEYRRSAAANRLVSEFALGLIDNEKLGRDETTDFLFVGFSANDYAGHFYGPYSEEVRKMTHETDAEVAELLRQLDAKVGRGKYWFVMSADHGVAPSLAEARDTNLAHLEAKNIDSKALRAAIENRLDERWGSGHWLLQAEGLYFDRKVLSDKNVRIEEAARLAGEAAEKVPGVWGYVSRWGSHMPESIINSYARSGAPGRQADLEVVPYPFALPDAEKGGTTHGTPYTYDTQVPLIMVGAPFVPAEYYLRCSPADMPMTLAAMLHIHNPALANGRVLAESFPPRAAAAAAGASSP